MNEHFDPGDRLLFMKVGVHAKESLEDIIKRKTKEIEDTGYALWGYGGNTCHPTTMVQPFVREATARGNIIRLCMQEVESHHYAEQVRAEQCSVDGRIWTDIPMSINALGSRYALVIKNLRLTEFDLALDQTRVGVGNSSGRLGSKYISGRVDKGCLEYMDAPQLLNDAERKLVPIRFVADLLEPFAVMLRNKP